MADPRFFRTHGPFTLEQIAAWTGAHLPESADAQRPLSDVAPLDRAGPQELSFLDNIKYREQFERTGAGACFVRPGDAARAPQTTVTLISDDPYRAYALAAQHFYPDTGRQADIAERAHIHAGALLGAGCAVEPGAVVHDGAQIGEGCIIGANAVIGRGVQLGADCRIGANVALSHCLIGDRVIIHPGAQIGQDGFGFAMGRAGHVKVPQLGRVLIEADVEIGAGTCIDRGAGPDTVIGEGTKIDNLVQIGHNVQIGKHCIIVSQVGISGSTSIGNGVVIAGQAGIGGHLHIGDGAVLAARSAVMKDLPGGVRYGGMPAVPIKDWQRQIVALHQLVKQKRSG